MDSEIGSTLSQRRRVLVVEDELLIGMLLEDMLNDLGYEVVATVGRLEEALQMAREAAVDVAILDVNLNGQEVYPVADVLAGRNIPFVFASGYGDNGLPAPHQNRPTLPKPFQQELLQSRLAALLAASA